VFRDFSSLLPSKTLLASLPVDVSRLQRSGKERSVVGTNQGVTTIDVAELELTYNLGNNGLQLRVGKVLTNTSVTTGTEGQVRRGRTLADETVTIVDLLLILATSSHSGEVGRIDLPSVGVPLIGVGEISSIGSADTRGSHDSVRSRDDVLGSGDLHGRLDGAHDGVNRGVEAESLLDDGLVKGQLGEVIVGQGREIGTELSDLLLVEFLHDLRVLGETEHDPRASGRRRVLASHEQGNHHVGDLVVRDRGAVLVGGVHEMLHHIVLGLVVVLGTALLDGVHVDLGNGALSVVTLSVPGERSPVKHEVDGGEAHIKIVVESGQRLVELVADDAALEGVRSSEDSDLGHLLGNIDNTGLALEICALLEVITDLAGNDGNVGSEGFGSKGNLHELRAIC
jgi:hypothetical protein